MADQRKITLRATHATPKNIILRELPVATPSAGTTIYLYENHATPKNIILRNPLVADAPAGGGAFEITATSSAITLAGSSVILAYGRVILASTSAIALAASSTTLAVGYKISATSSAITLAGSTATLAASRSIDATSSAIALEAPDATIGVGYVLEAQSSAIALAASAVDLEYTAAVISIRRGDDAWRPKQTGTAKQAIYKRLVEEIETRFIEAPVPKTYRKRKARIIALTKAVEALPEPPRPDYYDLEPFTLELAGYDGSEARYEALINELEQQLAVIVSRETRRLKHRNIAMAMLLAA